MSNKEIEQSVSLFDEFAIQEQQVTIKVLTVGKKQMTQAFFRQMIDESIFDGDTGALLGTPWGRVSYHVGCEGIPSKHFHVIWQKGQELRRSIVAIPWSGGEGVQRFPLRCNHDRLDISLRQAAHLFVSARMLEGWGPEKKSETITVKAEGEVCETWLSQDEQNYWLSSGTWQDRAKELLEARLRSEGYAAGDSSSIYKNVVTPRALNLKHFKQAWMKSYDELLQMDRIFI